MPRLRLTKLQTPKDKNCGHERLGECVHVCVCLREGAKKKTIFQLGRSALQKGR